MKKYECRQVDLDFQVWDILIISHDEAGSGKQTNARKLTSCRSQLGIDESQKHPDLD